MNDVLGPDAGDSASLRLTEIHRLSDELQRLLGLGQPPILGIKLRGAFVQAVREPGGRAWLGYGVSTALSLVHAVPKVSWHGTPPQELDGLLDLLRWIADQPVPPFVDEETWRRGTRDAVAAVERHRNGLASILDGRLAAIPGSGGWGSFFPWSRAAASRVGASRAGASRVGVSRAGVSRAGASRVGASDPADEARAHGLRVPGPSKSAGEVEETVILVPVVACVAGTDDEVPSLYRSLEAGCVLTLRVRALTVHGRGRGPHLVTNGKLSEEMLAALREVLGACGELGIAGAPPLRHVLFEVDWDAGSAAQVIGRSARLAFLLAAASAWARLSTLPVQTGLLPRTAATGDLDGTAVRPVDAGTLALKVRACFFSPADVLCVPAGQQEVALAEVRRLNELHPNRQLLVRPCEDVCAVWGDSAIVTASARPARRMAGNLLRRAAVSRMTLVLVFLGVLLAGGLAVREAVLSVNLPVDVAREERALVAHNQNGRACLRIPILPGKLQEPYLVRGAVGFIQSVVDVDGDGKNEVAAIHYGATELPDLLTVFSRRKRIIWERRASLGLMPDQQEQPDLHWPFFVPLPGASPSPGLLVIRKSARTSFSLVERVDAATGRTTGALWNSGHFERIHHLDLDQDGVPEWVVLGTDNESHCGVLAVIDPSAMHLPTTGDWTDLPYVLDPVQIGRGVRAVVLFPKDRFTPGERVSVLSLTPDAAGAVAACVEGHVGGDVLYILRFKKVDEPTLIGVQFNDAYRQQLRGWFPGSPIESDIAKEEQRLAGEVRVLAASGVTRVRNED